MAFVKLNDLELVEAPPQKRPSKPDPLKPLLMALANHPGKWAMLATGMKGSSGPSLRRTYPDFEFIFRSEKEGAKLTEPAHTLWGCYRGTEWVKENLAKARERADRKASRATAAPGVDA